MKRIQTVTEVILAVLTAGMIVLTSCFRSEVSGGRTPVLEKIGETQMVAQERQREMLLDINSATAQELEDLPGVGEVLAERIVAWRTENGGFSSAEDILSVSGIGEATYEKILPYITVR